MSRTWNFYAGPAILPAAALERAKAEIPDWDRTGMSVMETSHRSKEYDLVHHEAMDLIKSLLALDDDHQVLFIQGGASLQFAMLPMNFIPKGGSADYVITGSWSQKALKEANIVAKGRVAATGEGGGFTRIPDPDDYDLDPEAAYVHITSNNTIKGTQFREFPNTDGVPLVARDRQPRSADDAFLRYVFGQGFPLQHSADLCHLHGAQRARVGEGRGRSDGDGESEPGQG